MNSHGLREHRRPFLLGEQVRAIRLAALAADLAPGPPLQTDYWERRSEMPTQAKSDKIVELTDKLSRASVAILVQTQGLKVKDMNELRAKMRAANVEFQIAKNTLLRIASERNNMSELDTSIFNGQTAVAFGYEDEVATAKVIND